jgi:RNA polymerase sigma-70 factor (ECF subfamily)
LRMDAYEPGEDDATADAGPDSWAGLMARAQAGDQAAYRALLIAVSPYVHALARRYLRERADVEDAVQDILVAVHTVRHTFDPARPFRPWLSGVARFRLMDRLRGAGRRAARDVSLGPEHETFAVDTTKSDQVALDRPALRRAMAELSEGQRQAIELTKLREMSLKEASVESGMSVSALKVATHRGMARLRVLLTGRDGS